MSRNHHVAGDNVDRVNAVRGAERDIKNYNAKIIKLRFKATLFITTHCTLILEDS
ncbi:hypothetical protein A2U01_0080591, partial [Trifolium medium]|nr:hypothetical protein [Trifolium medium]